MEQKLRTSLIGITISFSLLTLTAQAQTPTFTAASVVNAASRVSGSIAPGMVAAIMGSNLGDPVFYGNCMNVTPPLPTCSAVTVLVNGAAAPKIFDSASEVTFQVPFTISGSTATIQVTSTLSGQSLSSAVVTVPVAAVAPGLFSANGTGSGTGYYYDSSGLVAEYSQAVQLGDTVVLFATGFGATNPPVATGTLGPTPGAAAAATVTMTINNQSVPVTFAGLEPGDLEGALPGYDEVVFTVPSTLTVPTGQLSATFPVVVTVGGVATQSVNLVVAAPPVTITSISPSPVPLSASAQTITVNGSGFESGLTLKLQSPTLQTTTVSGSSITFISATQFTAQVTVGTAGSWGALVSNPLVNNQGTQSSVFNFTVSGTVSGNGPTITSIVTTNGDEASQTPQISQNAWIEVHGTNLSQGAPLTWSNSNFDNGLPTTLGGVTATVDGKPAAIYYVSPSQVNILAPLDTATGSVPVQLSTPNGTTAVTATTEVQASPAFLVFDTAGHVAAEHVHPTVSLLGPTSLGSAFTPATPGETVAIYATGFGQTSPAFTNQLTNTGLPGVDPFPINLSAPLPTVTIGNLPATVSFAGLVGPGLYQINLTVPASAPAGDLPILALYNGASTQSTAVITVQ
jgi:uncharacterized protein (TIGR03437 family)